LSKHTIASSAVLNISNNVMSLVICNNSFV
jgi:hypothetical protein